MMSTGVPPCGATVTVVGIPPSSNVYVVTDASSELGPFASGAVELTTRFRASNSASETKLSASSGAAISASSGSSSASMERYVIEITPIFHIMFLCQ